MVTSIQLGNFFNAGGRTVLGGVGGSGLDTQSLIEGLLEARRIPAVRIEERLAANESKTSALITFRGLMNNLQDAMNFLRNPPGVGNASDNVFRYTTSSLTSNTAIDASTYVSVTSAPGATLAEYTIDNITSVAAATKQSTGLFAIADANTSVVKTTPVAGEFGAGTFTLNGEDITFDVGDSLNVVAAKVNAVSGDTNISASIVQVGDGSYQLFFTATSTGVDADFDINNVDPAGTLVDGSGVFTQITVTEQQNAANAIFDFNGTTITRQTNAVGDLVSDVTFNILNTTPALTEVTVNIKPDEDIAKSGIVNFINAYNEIKLFAAEQNEVGPDGTFVEEAVLNGSSTLRTSLNSVTRELSSLVAGLTGNITRLGDVGIVSADLPESTEGPLVRNILNVDDTKLTQILASDFDGVRKLFEFDFVSNNPNLRVFSRTNAIAVNNISFALNPFAIQTTKIYEIVDADTPVVATTPDSNQIQEGSVIINGISIDLVDGESLNQVAQKFNDVTGTTGVTAEVVENDTNKFSLKFTSIINGVNVDLTSTSVNPNGVFDDAGISATSSLKATFDPGSGPIEQDLVASIIRDSSGNATGLRLAGQDGTELEGLVLVYAGILSSNVTVSTTQGVADRIYNIAEGILEEGSGLLATEIAVIEGADKRLNEEIKRIEEQVDRLREVLLAKFGALEAAISRTNTLLQSIDASNNARNNA